MSTAIWTAIRGDLRRILLGVPGIPDVAWELAPRPYSPTTGVPYLREAIEKGASRTRTLGAYGRTEEEGIYKLDLYWPPATQKDGEDLADRIRLAFWHGRSIQPPGPDGIWGSVLSSQARTAIPRDDWTVFPVRVAFFVHRRTSQGLIA